MPQSDRSSHHIETVRVSSISLVVFKPSAFQADLIAGPWGTQNICLNPIDSISDDVYPLSSRCSYYHTSRPTWVIRFSNPHSPLSRMTQTITQARTIAASSLRSINPYLRGLPQLAISHLLISFLLTGITGNATKPFQTDQMI